MRETSFIERNKEEWETLERVLESDRIDPDLLTDLFIKTTDNLSYSRTFYPNRSVRVYLNALAQRIYAGVYRSKRQSRGKLVRFWTEELPDILWESRLDLLLSLAIFLLACAIGALSSAYDPEFAEVMLGSGYVEKTVENIEAGDPMNVYKDRDVLGMWLGITMNNILVALRTFALGLLFAVGSIFIMLYNGIMVGAFQYFFVEYGLLQESFLTIFMHGAAELSAIVIAGAAGLTMGRGLLFPGTYTRTKSLQLSARRGLKIMVAVVVMLIFAGFVEAWITRLTEVPEFLRALFIFGCFAIILFYFAYYPWYRYRQGRYDEDRERRVAVRRNYSVDYRLVKPMGTILTDAFVLFGRRLKTIAWVAPVLAMLQVGVLYFFNPLLFERGYSNNFFDSFFGQPFTELANGFSGYLGIALGGVALTLVALATLYPRTADIDPELRPLRAGLVAIPAAVLFAWLQSLNFDGSYLLRWVLTLPIVAGIAAAFFHSSNPFKNFVHGFALSFGSFGKYLGISVVTYLLFSAFVLLIHTQFVSFFVEVILTNFYVESSTSVVLERGITLTLLLTVLYLCTSFWITAIRVFHYSHREVREATGLLSYIDRIGEDRRIRGMLRE